ncbi:MAG: hypothetical protein LH603_05750 [Pseudonocardia sp.]|nr:hypothetical protein [Pseudonocardia sp.]
MSSMVRVATARTVIGPMSGSRAMASISMSMHDQPTENSHRRPRRPPPAAGRDVVEQVVGEPDPVEADR